MNEVYQLTEACWKCLTLNGSLFFLIYGTFVLYFGVSFDKKWILRRNNSNNVISDLAPFKIPPLSIQTIVVQFISRILTPRIYILILRLLTKKN